MNIFVHVLISILLTKPYFNDSLHNHARRFFHRYVYTDDTDVNEHTVIPLLHAARLYDLTTLASRCSQWLSSQVNPTNACSLLAKSLELKQERLAQTCLTVIQEHTAEALSADGFVQISRDTLCYILDSERLSIPEVTVFDYCMAWAKHQLKQQPPHQQRGLTETRVSGEDIRQALGQALFKIRLPTLSLQDFTTRVVPAEILNKEEELSIFRCLSMPRSAHPCGGDSAQQLAVTSFPMVKRQLIEKKTLACANTATQNANASSAPDRCVSTDDVSSSLPVPSAAKPASLKRVRFSEPDDEEVTKPKKIKKPKLAPSVTVQSTTALPVTSQSMTPQPMISQSATPQSMTAQTVSTALRSDKGGLSLALDPTAMNDIQVREFQSPTVFNVKLAHASAPLLVQGLRLSVPAASVAGMHSDDPPTGSVINASSGEHMLNKYPLDSKLTLYSNGVVAYQDVYVSPFWLLPDETCQINVIYNVNLTEFNNSSEKNSFIHRVFGATLAKATSSSSSGIQTYNLQVLAKSIKPRIDDQHLRVDGTPFSPVLGLIREKT